MSDSRADFAEPVGLGAAPSSGAGGRRRYDTVEMLRFVAALMVVFLHSTFYTHERLDPSFPIYASGVNGVRLFFVISGFVMVVSSEKLIGTADGWRVFATKRILRIVPLYWLITTVKLAILIAVPAVVFHAAIDWDYIAKSYAFIPARNVEGEISPLLGVGWTLNFEMFFYALFTFAIFARLRPMAFLAPVLVGLSLLSLLRTSDWPVPIYFFSDPVVLDFLAGMLLALWAKRGLQLPAQLAWPVMALGMIGLFVPWTYPGGSSAAGDLLNSFIRTLLAAAVVLGAIALEARLHGRLPRRVLFMGGASYSLYLIHPIVSPAAPHILQKLGWHLPWLAVAGSIAIAIVASTILYRFFEKPFSKIAERMAKRLGLLGNGAREPVSAGEGAAHGSSQRA